MNKISNLHLAILEKATITCRDFEALLLDFTDKELPTLLDERLTVHFMQCPACRASANEYQQVITIAKELRPKKLPNGVRERLRMNLSRELGVQLAL
jgi:hypothetical protein